MKEGVHFIKHTCFLGFPHGAQQSCQARCGSPLPASWQPSWLAECGWASLPGSGCRPSCWAGSCFCTWYTPTCPAPEALLPALSPSTEFPILYACSAPDNSSNVRFSCCYDSLEQKPDVSGLALSISTMICHIHPAF